MNRRKVTFLTTEGRVTYSRYCLTPTTEEHRKALRESTGSAYVFPLDEHLGLDRLPFRITCSMALRLAKISASSQSYEAARAEVLEYLGVEVSCGTLRRVTNHIGDIVLAHDLEEAAAAASAHDPSAMRAGRVRGRIPKDALNVYLMMDGAMFNSVDRSRGKGSGAWRESKLAVAFRSDDLVVTRGPDGKEACRIGRREYASSVDGVETFRRLVLALARRNGLAEAHNVVIVGDGARWIRNTRDELFPSAVLILDLYHLKERVGEFARFLFPNDSAAASAWAREKGAMLEEGRWREFLRLDEVAPYARRDTPEGVVNIYRYVHDNRDAIEYPTYRRRGYFVGSGAIESANKTVTERRLKQAGMRWRADLAGGMLALRCKLMSGLWDSDVAPLVREKYPGSVYDDGRDSKASKGD